MSYVFRNVKIHQSSSDSSLLVSPNWFSHKFEINWLKSKFCFKNCESDEYPIYMHIRLFLTSPFFITSFMIKIRECINFDYGSFSWILSDSPFCCETKFQGIFCPRLLLIAFVKTRQKCQILILYKYMQGSTLCLNERCILHNQCQRLLVYRLCK